MEQKQFWNTNYEKKLGSGKGSVGKVRKFKHKILKNYLNDYENFSFLDFGNGDLSFWYNKPPKNYIGIDFSDTIQDINRMKFKGNFITANLSEVQSIKADVVICFDVLFHIINEIEFKKILLNLCISSRKFIFIYTWLNTPPKYEKSFQKFRNLNQYDSIFESNGFERIQLFLETRIDSCGAMYVFRRKQ